MAYEASGAIKLIMDTVTFDSGFQKREFVVTTKEQYPQDLKFEVMKDKCSMLDKWTEGQEVKVEFNLRGNEYNGKYFVNLGAWRITATENTGYVAPVATPTPEPIAPPLPEDDDLPF